MDPLTNPVAGPMALALAWVLTLAAFGTFGLRITKLVGLLRKGRPENRFDQPAKRFQRVIEHVFLQPRLFNEPTIGLPHLLIFWGFCVYVVCFNWGLARALFPFLPAWLPYPDDFLPAAFFLDVFGLLVLAGLAAALVRRTFYAPPHLHLSVDANLILAWIGTLMASSLVGSAAKLVGEGGHPSLWRPVGSLLMPLFSGLTVQSAFSVAKAMWWVHTLGVLSFLMYLPYSKHLHLLASPFNVYFGTLRPAGDLAIAGGVEESAAGASEWNQFTWKQLLGGFSCAECGRCDRSCPAANSGFPLEPQEVIQKLKRHTIATGLAKPGTAATALIGGVMTEAEVWSCVTCMSCMERCAVLNEQIPTIVQLRRHLVSEGAIEKTLQDTLANLNRYGNSFGKSDRMRAKWTQPVTPKIKDARKEPVEVLWFTGDYAAYDPRLEDITRKTAAILQCANVDFGLLYEGERNAGNDVRRVGEEGLFEILRDKNLDAMGKATYKTIVTTDPHSYNTLKNEYPWNGNRVPVLHYSELIDQLLAQGRIPLKKKLAGRVTYHDPCYLGRYNGVYDAPRRVLAALGLTLVEMPRNRNRSYCCGAGGGRIWMEDTPGIKERPSENRVREAAALPDVGTLVVCCPKDIAMFRDAAKTTGNEATLAVKDLAELVWEAMQD